jgi:hypothetical protein
VKVYMKRERERERERSQYAWKSRATHSYILTVTNTATMNNVEIVRSKLAISGMCTSGNYTQN